MELKICLEIGLSPALQEVLAAALSFAPDGDSADRGEVSQAGAENPTPTRNRGGRPRKPVETPAASATPASGAQSSALAADPLGLAGGQTATTGAGQGDDAAALAAMLGETGPAAGAITKDAVAAALRAAMDKGVPMPTLQDVFVSKGNGAKSIGQVDPSLYGAVHAEFTRLLAA